MDSFREQLNALRATGDDLQSPEWAELSAALQQDPALREEYDRIQAWDRKIQESLAEVPLPAGLEERLLAAVASETPTEESPVELPCRPATSRRSTRRAVILGFTAAAASMLLAFGIYQWLNPEAPLTESQVASMSREWIDGLDSAGWQTTPSPEDYPVDSALRVKMTSWRRIDALGDSRAVVHRGLIDNQVRAYLVVIRTDRTTALPSVPPRTPKSATQGWSVACWKTANAVYVLRVKGDARMYQRAIRALELA